MIMGKIIFKSETASNLRKYNFKCFTSKRNRIVQLNKNIYEKQITSLELSVQVT